MSVHARARRLIWSRRVVQGAVLILFLVLFELAVLALCASDRLRGNTDGYTDQSDSL